MSYAYLEATGDESQFAEADRILYPAYGTYVGNAIGNFSPANAFPIYLGTTALGHVNGRMLTRQRKLASAARDSNSETNEIQLVSGEADSEAASALTECQPRIHPALHPKVICCSPVTGLLRTCDGSFAGININEDCSRGSVRPSPSHESFASGMVH